MLVGLPICDVELNVVEVAKCMGTNGSARAKGSLYRWSHIHFQDVGPVRGAGRDAGRDAG
jgi:hypothetical protein